MPFQLLLRPGATKYRDNDIASLHGNASFAFSVTATWIESGPGAGGPDLEGQAYSLDAICRYLEESGPGFGMSPEQIHRRVERLRAHEKTGKWCFLFVLVPLQRPVREMVLVFGFNREHRENVQFVDGHPPSEIICDTVMGWLL